MTELGGEIVAVPIEMETDFHGIIRLNETGADIVRGLIDGLDENQIADRILETYDGFERDSALKAIADVVEKLRAEGLVTE